MSAAITAAVIVAGGAAYAAHQQRSAAQDATRAASRPTTGTVDNTTSTSPRFLPPDDINYAREEARRLYDQGTPLYGGGNTPTGAGGSGGDQAAANAAEVARFRAERRAAGSGTAAPSGSAGAAGGSAARPGMAAQARTAGQAIIDQGMAGSPNQASADGFIQRTLAPGGYGGNEVYQDLAGRYGNASLDSGSNLLMQFLNGQGGNNYNTSASGQGTPGGQVGRTNGGGVDGGYVGGHSASNGNLGGSWGASGPPAVSQNMVTDSTASPGLFNDWAKRTLSGSLTDPNNPDFQAYLDVVTRRGQSDLDRQLQDVADEASGAGMYGGSGLALERARTRTLGDQGISDARTTALLGFRGQGLDAEGNAAGLVNQRDLGNASLGLQASEGAANRASSSASNQAGIDAQLQIANRGMDLNALQSYIQNQQFGLGQLGDMGAGIDATRLGAMGQLGNAEALRYSGLNAAFGTANTIAGQEAAARARQQDIDFRNANLPQSHLQDYLSNLGFVASLGSDTRTSGQTTGTGPSQYVNPGPSPGAAGLTAGLGAWLQAYGARNQGTAASAPVAGGGNATTQYGAAGFPGYG